MPNVEALRAEFRKLHESGCFVIPNPWDIGSALYLAKAGFKAVASTSSGLAFTRGLSDSPPRDLVLTHLREICSAVNIPVHADFQSGYASDANGVAESVRLCIDTGVAGLSIEDSSGDPAKPLYELPEALDRLAAAREEIDHSGSGVSLTARAECFLVGHSDPLRESIRRLQAYAEAGADVLFAPGVRDPDSIRAVLSAVSPKPVNVIMSANLGLSVGALADMGVRRISVGSALSRVAWGAFMRATTLLAEGSFAGFDGAATFADLNDLFADRGS
jgi:2-methylisocitrate lyase-like PEP mutase family enzyme